MLVIQIPKYRIITDPTKRCFWPVCDSKQTLLSVPLDRCSHKIRVFHRAVPTLTSEHLIFLYESKLADNFNPDSENFTT